MPGRSSTSMAAPPPAPYVSGPHRWFIFADGQKVDHPATMAAFGDHYGRQDLIGWVSYILDTAQNIGFYVSLEHEYFFFLARRIKGQVPAEERADERASAYAPLAVLFAEAVDFYGQWPENAGAGAIDWEDPDQITLAFESAWRKARYAEGMNLLADGVAWADAHPIDHVELSNRHVKRLVGLARYLQMVNGPDPIQLPLRTLEPHLGISHVAVSHVLDKALDLGWIILEDPSYSQAKRKAKLFRFNWDKLPKHGRSSRSVKSAGRNRR